MSITMGYKMTHDHGFAPNPFHGVLTLATCKPRIRAHRDVGEWVAGFASQELVNQARRRGVTVQLGGLIYLMQITEVLPLDAYFEDPRFAIKRPPTESLDPVALCGDNIYYRDHHGEYEQLENRFHGRAYTKHDTGGLNALISSRFYYFGRECFAPDGSWTVAIGAPLSSGRTFYCPDGFVEKLLNYFNINGIVEGMHALPALMDETHVRVRRGQLTCSFSSRSAQLRRIMPDRP